jgi:hypothetical protein
MTKNLIFIFIFTFVCNFATKDGPDRAVCIIHKQAKRFDNNRLARVNGNTSSNNRDHVKKTDHWFLKKFMM